MKKITLTLIAFATMITAACSSDDSPEKLCNCTKYNLTYNEAMQVYEVESSEFYSNDCDDEVPTPSEDENGNTYRINCTPEE